MSYCYTCPRPAEFGHIGNAWDIVGWRVDVAFQRLPRLVRPKNNLAALSTFIEQEQFSPLRATGDGLQHVYLTSISSPFAHVLLNLAGATVQALTAATSEARPAQVECGLSGQQEWEDIEQRRIIDAEIPATTRQALIRARIGQGLFKERVSRIERACRLTFVDNPSHLIASHIKPWRESTNEERLHQGNGLLLTPNADHLFDRGFVTFEDNGEVVMSPVADVESLRRLGLSPEAPPQPQSFNIDQKHFLAHHRREVFLSAVA